MNLSIHFQVLGLDEVNSSINEDKQDHSKFDIQVMKLLILELKGSVLEHLYFDLTN